ncbi:fluoride efflux transporter CrcB [Apibacter sp. B3889]|uniref:fluoride efflux transporter CrcB n=1 Tax=unclassified Apibacter TaxID=2630820 RepID=UPI0013297134|nr:MULTISPECIES: fluoride efflux transporter CrcB [unclassified Apibacter]MXO31630.1 fluoride efflux transporter CrcB [Apibacter sp. B2912]MXO34130.1 fluoride efflux transporter CrcB [Apibacter sp. B3883]MXO41739.1 fluoride efflux transporter CrcB [Apibacter sp. B3889]MXP03309.1 fluoride efflux transporter CrcB [Apibacter sp. B3887]MXP07428.1 fluoride efflux transporter CrcB [Apibacter sp. B3935]
MIYNIFLVGLGGSLGTIIRYLLTLYIQKYYGGIFPLATFLINCSGCIVIGLFLGLSERFNFINNEIKLLLVTGFCGGYTTFSTFSAENLQLYQNHQFFTLALYIGISILVGILGVWIGNFISKI